MNHGSDNGTGRIFLPGLVRKGTSARFGCQRTIGIQGNHGLSLKLINQGSDYSQSRRKVTAPPNGSDEFLRQQQL
jgi:hypothetical protein